MNTIVFKLLYASIVAAMNAIRIYYMKRYKKYHSRETTIAPVREKLLTQIMFVALAVPGLMWLFTSWLSFGQFYLPHAARIAGFAAGAYSMYLFYRIHRALGDNWSPVLETRSEHTLIVSGMYRRVRHPMYADMLLWAVAFVLITANWFYAAVLCAGLAVLFVVRIPDEEKLMTERFGEQYREYMRHTKRLIPYIY